MSRRRKNSVLLTPQEVANELGVDREDIVRYAKAGAIPNSSTVPGVIRIHRDDVEDLRKRMG